MASARLARWLALLAACGGEPSLPAELRVAGEPAPTNPIAATLDGVAYLGNDVDGAPLTRGGAGRIVHYWKVVAAPGDGWRPFAQLTSDAGDWLALEPGALAGARSGAWRAGDVLRDVQRFTLPTTWRGDAATLHVGLERIGVAGVAGRRAGSAGPVDPQRRITAARFAVAAGAAGEYVVRRASGPLELDGVADEPAWRAAPRSPPFSDAEGGPAVGGGTVARLLWDDQHLHAFVEVEDADVGSPYRGRDDPLWKADVVELFIDADGDRKGYVELQANPHGAIFDAFFPGTRAGPPGQFDWNGGMRAAVVVHGTLDQPGDRDRGWDVELAIPLADVRGAAPAMPVRLPPAPGDRWRLNLVRVEKPANGGIRAASWNPITIQDFHALGRMLTVTFGDAQGAVPR